MTMLEKLKAGFGKKAAHKQTSELDVYKKRLKGIVYEDELINELAPVFAKLAGQEGFEKVWELIESKERQLEVVAGGDWTTSTTTGDEEEETSTSTDGEDGTQTLSAEEILAAKYKTQ